MVIDDDPKIDHDDADDYAANTTDGMSKHPATTTKEDKVEATDDDDDESVVVATAEEASLPVWSMVMT
jgi:hypothetical protein